MAFNHGMRIKTMLSGCSPILLNPLMKMSQNGLTQFEKIGANAARFLKCVDHFETLCIIGLKHSLQTFIQIWILYIYHWAAFEVLHVWKYHELNYQTT